jgi:hypothetical protein
MTNNDQALYFVLELRADGTEWCDAIAICLVHGMELPLPWTAWVMNDHPFKVKFCLPDPEPDVFDYSFYTDTMRQMIQTTYVISLGGSAASTPVPFYLASDTNRSPTNYEVTVQLLFDTIDFLPQVQVSLPGRMELESMQAEIASHSGRFRRFFERIIYREPRREATNLPAKEGIEVRVRSQKLFPGLYLPVSVGDIEVPGVLLLKESLGERDFRATLYASDNLEKIQLPVGLVSTEMWWDDQREHHTLKKVIGSIVEMT